MAFLYALRRAPFLVLFTIALGNFWMFGGYGNAADTSGSLNVLWRY